MARDGDAELTIDELARQTGMTVRNIRAHQSRGLLPPPEVRGRTGYYGSEHVDRIELIKELQMEGYNLDLIRRLVESVGGSSTEVLRFTRTLRAPFVDEEPEMLEAQELAALFPEAEPALLRKAEELGILRDLGDGRFETPSPRLLRAGAELAALGISPDRALVVVARIRRQADSVARTFAELFLENVWKPFDRAGRPEEGWAEIRDAVERLRPLATESLVAVFQLAMTDAVDDALGKELARVKR